MQSATMFTTATLKPQSPLPITPKLTTPTACELWKKSEEISKELNIPLSVKQAKMCFETLALRANKPATGNTPSFNTHGKLTHRFYTTPNSNSITTPVKINNNNNNNKQPAHLIPPPNATTTADETSCQDEVNLLLSSSSSSSTSSSSSSTRTSNIILGN
jgi:hypothetical protein